MAMVVITDGEKKLKVSMGAYNGMYKKNGWKLDKPEKVKERPTSDDVDEVDEWDKADEELANDASDKKSIDDMSAGELRKLAHSKGINVKGLNTIGELKKAIKEAK